MVEVVDLNVARALKTNDCEAWDEKTMLNQVITAIDTGGINPEGMTVVWFHRDKATGKLHYGRMTSCLSHQDQIALFNVALNESVTDWSEK